MLTPSMALPKEANIHYIIAKLSTLNYLSR